MKISKNFEIYIFISITIISIVTLWNPTVNYLQFYNGIKELTLKVTRSSLTFIEEEYRILLTLNATIYNPTRYKGIRIVSLMFRLCLMNVNVHEELAYVRIWFKEEPGELIEPYSSISKKYDLNINLNGKKECADIIKRYIENAEKIPFYLVDIRIDIFTFMGRVMIPYENLPLDEV
jgi:hypothetical protein